jgi:hypothetical protein
MSPTSRGQTSATDTAIAANAATDTTATTPPGPPGDNVAVPRSAQSPLQLPPTGFVRTNDGIDLKYERFGSHGGPVVVLIHGWSGSRHYWVRVSFSFFLSRKMRLQ